MNTNDFICNAVLHIPGDYIDELCEEFDLDFSDDDVKDVIEMCGGNLECVGNELIRELFGKIIRKYKDELDEEKFDCYVNCHDSHLYYDGERICSKKDIEEIIEKKKFVFDGEKGIRFTVDGEEYQETIYPEMAEQDPDLDDVWSYRLEGDCNEHYGMMLFGHYDEDDNLSTKDLTIRGIRYWDGEEIYISEIGIL